MNTLYHLQVLLMESRYTNQKKVAMAEIKESKQKTS